MTECLDEEEILSFCSGDMALAKRPAVESHIAECDECRALVSAVARSSLVDHRPAATPAPGAASALLLDPAMAPTTPAQGGPGSAGESVLRGSGRSAPPPPAPVRAGDVLAGKYVVERVLGAGGMGVVVAARHVQLDRRVALKFLLPAACEAPGAIARFLREGKAAARITSEHVARVVDTGVLENGSPYLVMEYLEGSDLGAITAKRGPLPPAKAVEYVLQACEAIVEAHQLGIVHRDLKPANLFLTQRKDGSPLVKVLDFGISKADGGSKTQLTSTSMLMGSPRYMSPEQMVSAKDVDARTDVWALGVVIFELVTGKPVWQADTVQGLCALIATAPAPPLRVHAPHAPARLEEVVLRCLSKAPEHRIASIADLALALEPIAPASARVSIERILRVAGRTRGASPIRSVPPVVSAAPVAGSDASTSPRTSSGGRLVLVLSVVIGVLVVAGIALDAVVLRRPHADAGLVRSEPSVAPPPPPTAPSAASAPPPPTVALEPSPPVPSAPALVATAAAKASPPRVRPSAPAASAVTARAAEPPAPSPEARPTTTESPSRALSDRK